MFTGLESPTHLLFIVLVILLFFGGKRIPELARGLGKGMREFRQGLEERDEEHKTQAHAEETKKLDRDEESDARTDRERS
ncbi:MAG TPA: twin-arginine translocase TatA/TatE family subunit [Rubrobacteraceae bacterium]|nr:twin-arginine translocase TatA/TatE family subunit [Rubrobacteraceae bacterium]